MLERIVEARERKRMELLMKWELYQNTCRNLEYIAEAADLFKKLLVEYQREFTGGIAVSLSTIRTRMGAETFSRSWQSFMTS